MPVGYHPYGAAPLGRVKTAGRKNGRDKFIDSNSTRNDRFGVVYVQDKGGFDVLDLSSHKSTGFEQYATDEDNDSPASPPCSSWR